MSWSSISARGPQARFGHIVAFFEGVVYVIGGATAAGTDGVVSVLNDIWLYRFKTASWERVNPASALPPARYGHASGIAGYDIVIHGGRDAQGSALGDIWLYSTKSKIFFLLQFIYRFVDSKRVEVARQAQSRPRASL